MDIVNKSLRVILVMLSFAVVSGCSPDNELKSPTEQDARQQAPTKSTPPVIDDSQPDEFTGASAEDLHKLLMPYKHLDDYFKLMDSYGVEEQLQQSLVRLQKDPETLRQVLQLYEILTKATRGKKRDDFSEARWRAVYLLGELRHPDSLKPLYNIAIERLPEPENVFEDRYSSEFRLRARAIAGLEKLKSVEMLRKIYEQQTVLSGVAAASLYELGAAPKGVVAVDGKKVLGMGDTTDFKVKKMDISNKQLMIPVVSPVQGDQTSIVPTVRTDK